MSSRKKKQKPKHEPEPAPEPPAEKAKYVLPGILLLAFVARVLSLGRAELWQDEMLLVQTALPSLTLHEILSNYWGLAVSMAWLPLAALIENIFFQLAGVWRPEPHLDPGIARFPGVVLGTLGILGLYRAAHLVVDRAVALGATLMAAFFFYPIFYAREVHAYPALLCLAAFALFYFMRGLAEEKQTTRYLVTFAAVSAALVYTHLTATMYAVAMGVVLFVIWQRRKRQEDEQESAQHVFRMGCALGVALLAIAPFFVHILGGESPHLAEGSSIGILTMLNDGVSKMFLGEWPWASAVAWVCFIAGLIGLAKREEGIGVRRALVIIVLISFALVTIAAARTQYISARYYAAIAPACYIVFAQGLYEISALPGRLVSKLQPAKPFALLIALLLGVHVFIYLPPMYRLDSKSVDFGSIARWLNENLEPGTPYLLESAYEGRFVGGFYPTPGLVGAQPYVHRSGPGELDYLHQMQKQFMLEFPEAPFIESAHHNWNTAEGIWAWPSAFYRNKVILRNEPLRDMLAMKIYPSYPGHSIDEMSFTTYIYYNTSENLEALSREQGRPVHFSYGGWQAQPISQGQRGELSYARVQTGQSGNVRYKSLGGPTTGRFHITGAVNAPQGPFDVALQVDGRPMGTHRIQGGQLWQIKSDALELSGEGVLTIGVPLNQMGARAILLKDVRFVPEAHVESTAPPAALAPAQP